MSDLHQGTDGGDAMSEDRLQDYIRRNLEAAPPLSPEQRDRLALLWRQGTPGPIAPSGGEALAELLEETD